MGDRDQKRKAGHSVHFRSAPFLLRDCRNIITSCERSVAPIKYTFLNTVMTFTNHPLPDFIKNEHPYYLGFGCRFFKNQGACNTNVLNNMGNARHLIVWMVENHKNAERKKLDLTGKTKDQDATHRFWYIRMFFLAKYESRNFQFCKSQFICRISKWPFVGGFFTVETQKVFGAWHAFHETTFFSWGLFQKFVQNKLQM